MYNPLDAQLDRCLTVRTLKQSLDQLLRLSLKCSDCAKRSESTSRILFTAETPLICIMLLAYLHFFQPLDSFHLVLFCPLFFMSSLLCPFSLGPLFCPLSLYSSLHLFILYKLFLTSSFKSPSGPLSWPPYCKSSV